MNVKLRLVAVGRDRGGVHVDHTERRVVRQQVSAAGFAELAVARLRLVVNANIALSLGDLHCLGLPETKRVDRRGSPTPTRCAMTESRRDRLASNGEFHGATKATSLVSLTHGPPLHGFVFQSRQREYRRFDRAGQMLIPLRDPNPSGARAGTKQNYQNHTWYRFHKSGTSSPHTRIADEQWLAQRATNSAFIATGAASRVVGTNGSDIERKATLAEIVSTDSARHCTR